MGQCLGADVSYHVLSRDILDEDVPLLNIVADKMVADVDMLGLGVM
jgi:hypothetical protein